MRLFWKLLKHLAFTTLLGIAGLILGGAVGGVISYFSVESDEKYAEEESNRRKVIEDEKRRQQPQEAPAKDFKEIRDDLIDGLAEGAGDGVGVALYPFGMAVFRIIAGALIGVVVGIGTGIALVVLSEYRQWRASKVQMSP